MKNTINLTDMSIEEMLLNHQNYMSKIFNNYTQPTTTPLSLYDEEINKLLNLQEIINSNDNLTENSLNLNDENTLEYLDELQNQYELNNQILNSQDLQIDNDDQDQSSEDTPTDNTHLNYQVNFQTDNDENNENIFLNPTDNIPEFNKYRISSNFGHRHAPIAGASTQHNGIDIAAPINTHVLAPGNGVITKVSSDPKSGNYVKAKLSNGMEIILCHLNGTDLKVGDKFNTGDVLAKTGNTGNSTGAHLHLGIKINNKHVNPKKHINLNSLFE